jgi:hypothetical protein
MLLEFHRPHDLVMTVCPTCLPCPNACPAAGPAWRTTAVSPDGLCRKNGSTDAARGLWRKKCPSLIGTSLLRAFAWTCDLGPTGIQAPGAATPRGHARPCGSLHALSVAVQSGLLRSWQMPSQRPSVRELEGAWPCWLADGPKIRQIWEYENYQYQ